MALQRVEREDNKPEKPPEPEASTSEVSDDQLAMLLDAKPEVVSFHFGLPSRELFEQVRATGAFILVRRKAFDETPGFSWLKLEVSDDFGMCLMIKEHGGTCAIVNSRGEVALEWYSDFGEMTRSLQKNFFAITGRFSLARCLFQAAVMAWFGLAPLAMLLDVSPALFAIPLAGMFGSITSSVYASKVTGRPLAGGGRGARVSEKYT